MPERVKVVGDVKNLSSRMMDDASKKINEAVNEALKEAEKLLTEKREELLERVEVDVDKILDEAEALLNSEKAALEMEKKRRIEQEKKRFLDEVRELAWRKVLEEAEKQSERYKKFMEKALTSMSKEAGEDEVIVYVRGKDVELAKSIIESKNLKNLVEVRDVKEVGREMRGGALGKSKAGNVWYNYTLEKAFEEVLPEAYTKILALLA